MKKCQYACNKLKSTQFSNAEPEMVKVCEEVATSVFFLSCITIIITTSTTTGRKMGNWFYQCWALERKDRLMKGGRVTNYKKEFNTDVG